MVGWPGNIWPLSNMLSASNPGFKPSQLMQTMIPHLKQSEICAAADSVDVGNGVVVVTDMFGGSPCNLSSLACSQRTDRRTLYGANLPMLVKLAKSRNLEIDKAVGAAKDAGRKYIDSLD